jgi:hypothetical protein
MAQPPDWKKVSAETLRNKEFLLLHTQPFVHTYRMDAETIGHFALETPDDWKGAMLQRRSGWHMMPERPAAIISPFENRRDVPRLKR